MGGRLRGTLGGAVAWCATAGGAAWLLWEGLRLSGENVASYTCSSASAYAADATFASAGLLVAGACFGLSARLSGRPRWVAILAAAASAVMGLANGLEHCAYEPLWLLYVLGALGLTLSTAALGLVLLVTGALGRWRGLLLVTAAVGLMMLGFDRGAAAVFGGSWLVFGATLVVDRQALEPNDGSPRS